MLHHKMDIRLDVVRMLSDLRCTQTLLLLQPTTPAPAPPDTTSLSTPLISGPLVYHGLLLLHHNVCVRQEESHQPPSG